MMSQDAQSFVAPVRRVEKPWGYELIWALTDDYCGKILFVRAGEALSLQFHRLKDETIYLHEGLAELDLSAGEGVEPSTVLALPGHSFRVRPGVVHRLRAVEDSLFLEVSTPHLDDVVRIEDRYGRTERSDPEDRSVAMSRAAFQRPVRPNGGK